MSAMSSYTATRDKIRALREQAKEAARTAFNEGAAGVFKQHPALQSFGWTQYTPYFNDGDACTFSVQNEEVDITFGGIEHEYFSITYLDGEPNAELKAAATTLNQFMSAFEDDDYRDMFGDHVRVKVTPAGIDVEGYDHD